MRFDLLAMATILAAALLAIGLLFRFAWRRADALGSVHDWGNCALLGGIGLLGLVFSPVLPGFGWQLVLVCLLFASCAYFLRGLIRYADGRNDLLLNAIARQLAGLTAVICAVHLALGLVTGSVNYGFFYVVATLTFLVALRCAIRAIVLRRDAMVAEGRTTRLLRLILVVAIACLVIASLVCLSAELVGSVSSVSAGYIESFGHWVGLTASVMLMASMSLVVIRLRRLGLRKIRQPYHADSKTGMLTNLAMLSGIRRHFGQDRYHPIIFLTVQIDRYDGLAKNHGAELGERLVDSVARAIHECCRETDLIARAGESRFVIAGVSENQSAAMELADRIRLRVGRDDIFLADGSPVPCSVCVGLSSPCDDLARVQDAARQAEDAMNHAQTEGGNQTIAYPYATDSTR